MSRLTICSLAALFFASVSLHAADNTKSYPASLCYQSTGPENSLKFSAIGDLSNQSADQKVTLFCPVVIERNQLSALEVDIVLIDEDLSGEGVTCQVSGSSFSSQYMSKWGNTASSEGGAGLQIVTTKISELNTEHSRYVKASLSCTLPPAARRDSKVAFVSYQVTEY